MSLKRELLPPNKSKCISLTSSLTEVRRKFGLLLEYTKATSKLSPSAIRGQTNTNVTVINYTHCNFVKVAWSDM